MSEIIVFYSWQHTLPKEINCNAIRQELRNAINLIEQDSQNFTIKLDEATRGKAGSPNIPETIMSKISDSDIFICDLTTINPTEKNAKLKTPNPNVLVELGYAIANLGWERIIMLVNTHYSDFPNDLPFDIDRQRASQFIIKNKEDKNGKGALKNLLKNALNEIITQKPPKPNDENLSLEIIKRKRDVRNLKKIMETINIDVFDSFFEEYPYKILKSIFYFLDEFKVLFSSSSFHVYDNELSHLLNDFGKSWIASGNHYKFYLPDDSDEGYYRFFEQEGVQNVVKNNVKYSELEDLSIKLRTQFKKLLNYIRNNYIEIDLEQTSQTAKDNIL